jgi:hypothetical protein
MTDTGLRLLAMALAPAITSGHCASSTVKGP